jgi:methylamine--corrinoid protein Co-methyltransferase
MPGPHFWEILDRAVNTGPRLSDKEFDLKVWDVASRLVKEHPDLKFDPENPVPTDDSLADEVWETGLEMYTELGTYCNNSGRVIKFTEEEIRESLKEVKGEIEIGAGTEKRTIKARKVDDPTPPSALVGGIIESDIPEGELFVKLYQALAQETLIDGAYTGPPVGTAEGRRLKIGSPFETHLGRCTAAWVREGFRRAGRPGLFMVSGCASGIADIAAYDEANGVRRTDGYAIPTTAELKTDYDCLHRLAYCMDTGILVQPYACPTMGGWAGGPEGVALATVAQGIMCVVVSQARNGKGYVGTGPNLQAPAIDTDRKSIWSSVLGAQAISRNTKMLHTLWALSAAGPGTDMQLRE